jgi:hypothetical protein
MTRPPFRAEEVSRRCQRGWNGPLVRVREGRHGLANRRLGPLGHPSGLDFTAFQPSQPPPTPSPPEVSKRCHLSPPLGVVPCNPSTGPEKLLRRGVNFFGVRKERAPGGAVDRRPGGSGGHPHDNTRGRKSTQAMHPKPPPPCSSDPSPNTRILAVNGPRSGLGGGVRRGVRTPLPNAAPRGNSGQNSGHPSEILDPIWATLDTDQVHRRGPPPMPRTGEQVAA